MATNKANVTVGKPAIGGSVHRAPTGTTPPTDAQTTLDAAFKDLGYISEDGITNSYDRTVEDIKAWGGDTVLEPVTDFVDSWKMTFIEAMNDEVLKVVYGDGNVTGALATGLTVKASDDVYARAVWAIDMILNGNVLKRVVLPDAQVAEIGDIVYVDGDPVGYEVTLHAHKDSSGYTHYEYFKNASSGSN